MRTLERKKNNSFNSLLLFILSSVLVHGLLLLIFAKSRRSLPIAKPKTNQNPIDFVVVPPEETIKEPPPETTKIAPENSVAKGKVQPDLPVASNKVGEATKTPAIKNPTTPKAQPQKITPPQPQAIKPPITPKVVKPKVEPQPTQKTEPIAKPLPTKPEPVKTEAVKPEPAQPEIAKPAPAIAKAPKKALPLDQNHPLLSKPQTKKPAAIPEQNITQPKPTIAKAPKTPDPNIAKQPKNPAPTKPDANSLAATTRTNQPQIPTTIPKPAKVAPHPPSTPAPEANSSAASLLGGNLSKSAATDQGSTFFSAQANASQTALNFNNSSNARRDPNLGPYFAEVRRKVKRNWKPSRPNDTKQTVLTFSIQSNGQISGLKVTQSSGSEQIDRESLAAVQNAAPFAALPANLNYPQLNVEFNFNLYIY